MRKLLLSITICALLSGCVVQDKLNTKRGRGDAPVAKVDDSAKEVIQFPDRFGNISHACDGHGHRVYVTTRTETGMHMEVINDDTCGAVAE